MEQKVKKLASLLLINAKFSKLVHFLSKYNG